MWYDRPLTVNYTFNPVDFGAGTYAGSLKGPKGYGSGELIDIGVTEITETFACDTITGKVRLGTSGDADAYAELIVADATAATNTFNVNDDTDAIIDAEVPGETQLELTTVQCTDTGTAAGIGSPYVIIAWHQPVL